MTHYKQGPGRFATLVIGFVTVGALFALTVMAFAGNALVSGM